jgi:hypothetical protein
MSQRSKRSPSFRSKIGLAVVVLVVVVAFTYFFYVQNQNYSPPGILIDWRMKLLFNDLRTSTNYTLPLHVGASGGAWINHTLDAFGPPGYSPMSTRDSSSVIWIQSTQPAVFNFGDFFNVWGQNFTRSCVSYAGIVAPDGSTSTANYCSRAAEPVIYDSNGNSMYDPSTDVNVTEVSALPVQLPSTGAHLSSDPHIMFISVKSSTIWNVNETIVYDSDSDGIYHSSVDPIIHPGANSTDGARLSSDPKLKFYDSNGNTSWDGSVPPPVMTDGTTVRCINRGINFSNGHTWVVILWSQLYRDPEIIGGVGCNPAG